MRERVGQCVCGFSSSLDPRSAAWHRAHEEAHMAAFPQAGEETRASLRLVTKVFERQEARAQERVS